MTPQILEFLGNFVPPTGSVIEIGSLHVNGSARGAITHKHWLGTDMRPGAGVDMAVPAAQLPTYFGPIFDTVVCCETLEHCENWREVFLILVGLATPGSGVVVITTPSPGFPRHDYPGDYWRFTLDDLLYLAGSCSVIASGKWKDGAGYPGAGVIFRNTGRVEPHIVVTAVL